jgi:hypothetical protein
VPNVEEVLVGAQTKIFVMPIGATPPTTLVAAWPASAVDLGYITKEGISESLNEDRFEIESNGYDSPIRTQITKRVHTFSATFQQGSAYIQSLWSSVPIEDMTSTGTGSSQYTSYTEGLSSEQDVRQLGIQIADRGGVRLRRFIVPLAEVTGRGDVSYSDGAETRYQLTWTTLAGPDGTTVMRILGQTELPEDDA